MNKIKWMSIFLLAAVTVALVFGAVAYRSVSAAEPKSTSTKDGSSQPASKGPQGGEVKGYSDEDLAAALGISVDKLEAARQEAKAAALAQAVEEGLITQVQADELNSDGSASPFGKRWSGWLSKNGIDFDALLANALGISVEELEAARAQAYESQLDQAVANDKLTQEQADLMKGQRALFSNEGFHSSMQTAFESAVKQAVTDGVITQAQADLILEKMNSKVLFGDHDIDMPGINMPGAFREPGRRGHGGDGPDLPAASAESTSP